MFNSPGFFHPSRPVSDPAEADERRPPESLKMVDQLDRREIGHGAGVCS